MLTFIVNAFGGALIASIATFVGYRRGFKEGYRPGKPLARGELALMLKEQAQHARDILLKHGDLPAAAVIANDVIQMVNDAVNAANVQMGTSLLARALILRGVHSVAAEWWSDTSRVPPPVTYAAIRSLVDDPPPEVETKCWSEDT